jgi:hypothetical protein
LVLGFMIQLTLEPDPDSSPVEVFEQLSSKNH